MFKTILRIFIVLIFVTVLGVAGLYYYNLNHTYFNKEDEIGNTTGNIYNGGLFSEQDDLIYFSNDSDHGSLYVMSSFCTGARKLSADIPAFINVDDNYIYYVRAVSTKENKDDFLVFNNSGVVRISQNGSYLKSITSDPSVYLFLKGNELYLQKYNVEDDFNLFRYQIDGTQERLLIEDKVIPMEITAEDVLYIDTTKKNSIKALNLMSYTTDTVYKGSYKYPMKLGEYIYYINIEDNKLYRMNKDGSKPTKLVNKSCSTYNITPSGKYLYYQVSDGKNNGIYRMNLETEKTKRLKKGNFKQINVTKNFVFFKKSDGSKTYAIGAEGGAVINTLESLIAPKEEE